MEKIVYFLGAGFSAPLGLPVMANFVEKSKDMVFTLNNSDNYKYFAGVLESIDKLSKVKNYYRSDLSNIEEILSIQEMQDYCESRKGRKGKQFIDYIADVIRFYTPKIVKTKSPIRKNYWDYIFGDNGMIKTYGFFVANLFNLRIREDRITGQLSGFSFFRKKAPDFTYSVITLNYDMVLEQIIKFLKLNYSTEDELKFLNPLKQNFQINELDWNNIYLAKLHGSIDPLTIVPPTWSKTQSKKLRSIWRLAHKLFEEANYIRILGYSLPESDSYVQYLLKSSIMKCKHLKRIDVICEDEDKTVEDRYNRFIDFKNFKFLDADIYGYLCDNVKNEKEDGNFSFNVIERSHKDFVKSR